MSWQLLLAGPARRALDRIPVPHQSRIVAALEQMQADPFQGDIVRLKAQPTAWRRRVGSWRILFDVDFSSRTVVVHDILRRTSTTY